MASLLFRAKGRCIMPAYPLHCDDTSIQVRDPGPGPPQKISVALQAYTTTAECPRRCQAQLRLGCACICTPLPNPHSLDRAQFVQSSSSPAPSLLNKTSE